MKIKLISLQSIPEVFKPISFHDGINLIMGEKVEEDNVKRGKKTNGVGKSLCIDFINFGLLKRSGRVAKIPEEKLPKDTKIILDLEINSKNIRIIRTIEKSENPIIIDDNGENEYENLDDANSYLTNLLFKNKENSHLSFREFIAPLTREEESEFKDITLCYDLSKRIPPIVKPHAYIFGLDVSIIDEIQGLFKEIEKTTHHKSRLKRALTENGSKKISDIKSILNSMKDDLVKIENTLESFKTNNAYESQGEELSKIQLEIDELRPLQSALRYQLKRINTLPALENIPKKEIEIVYNQFKSGLGDMVTKSIDNVMEFKKKIDDFQKRLFNEKIDSINEELEKVTNRLQELDSTRSEKLKIIDQKGVLKDIKNGFAIYQQKKDSYSKIQTKYDDYQTSENELHQLKSNKDQLFIELEKQISNQKNIIESFNETIIQIHEFIMDSNEASFEIQTINYGKSKQVLLFIMRIDDDGSHSVDRTKVFIYDISLFLNKYTKENHPKFLIHDNIFDVDQDTLIKSLDYLAKEETQEFQYILTLNRDKIENEIDKNILGLNIKDHVVANFTKKDRFLLGEKYSEK